MTRKTATKGNAVAHRLSRPCVLVMFLSSFCLLVQWNVMISIFNGNDKSLQIEQDAHQHGFASSTNTLRRTQATLPNALKPVTFKRCRNGTDEPWISVCFTEEACRDDSAYPFSSKEEAALFAHWDPKHETDIHNHFLQCKEANGQLTPPSTSGCSMNFSYFPTGCRRYSMSGGPKLPYSQSDISMTATHFDNMPILIFSGETDTFEIYNLVQNTYGKFHDRSYCHRARFVIPFLVDALRSHNPHRFTRGSPPFQLLFDTNDGIMTGCINNPKKCSASRWAPIFAFSSTPKDPKTLPSVKSFPTTKYMGCLFNWRSEGQPMGSSKSCAFPTEPIVGKNWSNLTPQLFWRGSDYPTGNIEQFLQLKTMHKFMKENKTLTKAEATDHLLNDWDLLTPRFRGIVLSLKAEIDAEEGGQKLPWINCKFFVDPNFTAKHGVAIPPDFYMGNYVDPDQMSSYKYHIDFGGHGGTTWLGTIQKLVMPGLLFHHETPMKDWFHDDMKPWIHYVPIKWDLSDLREKYDWAEAHQKKAESIAKAGTEFALRLITNGYMSTLYKEKFVGYGNEAVNAYSPVENETIDSILNEYVTDGFHVYRFSENSCWENVTGN